ncbi:MAG: hypothetical protein ACXW3R_09365 [Rhodoplanes sp.]
MNVAVTRGAEGFPRRAFSVDDIRRMIDIGLIGPEENFELIEGRSFRCRPRASPTITSSTR